MAFSLTPWKKRGENGSRAVQARGDDNPLARLRDEFDALFDRFFQDWPVGFNGGEERQRFWALDVDDTGKEVVVRAEAPGFEPQDFDIQLSGNTLTIRAEHKQEKKEDKEGYQVAESRYGHMVRSVTLPAGVDADKIDARYRNGVLELHLPRTEEAARKKIEVKA